MSPNKYGSQYPWIFLFTDKRKVREYPYIFYHPWKPIDDKQKSHGDFCETRCSSNTRYHCSCCCSCRCCTCRCCSTSTVSSLRSCWSEYHSVLWRRRTINPVFPICCLALILFLIAATIVLSLIPVYLSARKVNEVNTGECTLSCRTSFQLPFLSSYSVHTESASYQWVFTRGTTQCG